MVEMEARVLVIQHAADDAPGRVGASLTEAGLRLEVVRAFAGDLLPADLAGFAGLMVLGGEMGAYDDDRHPWLSPTKALLREAVAAEVPTLAICLGHQLLAAAAGGRVERAPGGQQGGARLVETTPEAADDPLFAVLTPGSRGAHWNNDLVTDLPPGAVVLARGPEGLQAMRVGRSAWGVQMHPEVDPETVRLWAEADVAGGVLAPDLADRWLIEIEAADEAILQAWRPVAQRFAELVRGRRGSAPLATAVGILREDRESH